MGYGFPEPDGPIELRSALPHDVQYPLGTSAGNLLPSMESTQRVVSEPEAIRLLTRPTVPLLLKLVEQLGQSLDHLGT